MAVIPRPLLTRIQYWWKWIIMFSRELRSLDEKNVQVQQQMLANSPLGMVLVDAQQPGLPIVYVNPAFERSTGYHADEVIGRNPRFLQGTDRNQDVRALIKRAIDREEVCTAVIRNYRKDGTLFWNELRITPIRDTDGRVTHYMGVQSDVTARVEAEQALTQSEARYRQMFDNNTAVKLVIDPVSGRIQEANAAAAAFYGYSRETLLSMRIQDINTLPEDEVSRDMKRAASQERTFFEFRHRLASGEIRDVDVFASPVDMPEGRSLFSIVVDVGRKREAERRYRALFEQSNDAVFILGLNGEHLDANTRAIEMLGYSPEELFQMSVRDTVVQDELGASSSMLTRLLAGERVPPYERMVRHKDGHSIPVEINAEIVLTSDGTPLHIQSVAREISSRKRMENALRESELRFRSLVEQSTDGITMTDEAGVLIEWNASMERLTGIPAREALGRFILDVQFEVAETGNRTPELYNHLKSSILDALETGNAPWMSQQSEIILLSKDGTKRIVQSVMFPIKFNTGYRIGSMLRDITERRQIEDALRASEERLRTIFENIPIMIGIFDFEGQFESTNPYWDERLGWTAVALSANPEALTAFYPDPVYREQVLEYMQSAQPGWRDFETVTRTNGTLSISWANIRLSDGRTIGFGQDITARKRMEESVRKSEESLRMIIEGTRAGTWEWHVQTGAAVYNARWAEIVGYTLEELAPISTQTWSALLHPEDRGRSDAVLKSYFAHEIDFYRCDVRMKHKDGHWVWVHSRGMVMEWDAQGQPLRMFGTHLDITERKQVEAELRESEEKYRLIAENTSDGILIYDALTGKVTYASPSYDRQYKREIGETVGMDDDDIRQSMHPDDRTAVFDQVYGAIARKERFVTYTYRSRRKDGIYFWREDHTRLIYAPDGAYHTAHIISRDITERKQAQEHEIAYALEKERTQMLTQFMQDAAHEFRTPLSVINTNAYLAARTGDADQRAVQAKCIAQEVNRIARLLDMLMMMTRLESDDPLKGAPLDIGAMLEASCFHCETIYGLQYSVKWEAAPDLPPVLADLEYLMEALNQIMDNAGRFNTPGGEIVIRAYGEAEQVIIEVRDTGAGIATEDLPYIFDTFWRRDEAHSTPGFGLGLPIAQRVVRWFGGDITVESTIGQGTCVRVTLPAEGHR